MSALLYPGKTENGGIQIFEIAFTYAYRYYPYLVNFH